MFEELIGKKFGRLTVLEIEARQRFLNGIKAGHEYYCLCKCDCGNEKYIRKDHIIKNEVLSCGCKLEENKIKHNLYKTRLYNIWLAIKERCKNKNKKGYKNYGGRGITVCNEWENDFKVFYDWAYANGYDDTVPRGICTIDRIDNNKGYSPDNCRWITHKEQQNNKRTNHFITYENEKLTLSQWEEKFNLKKGILSRRLRDGWSIEKALKTGAKN